ncbi:MAG: CsbD family protein [Peptostreptococcaceae bacterium]|nr:CsbD family protein [Peptostreptococcaceae bacterium]
MNKDIMEGKWEQVKGEVQKKWGKLTDDDLDVIKGDAKKLAGKLQEKYGMTKEEAEKAVEDVGQQDHDMITGEKISKYKRNYD